MITLEREGDLLIESEMIQALKEREAFQRFSTINDVIDASIGETFASGGIIVFVCDDFVSAFIDGSGWRAAVYSGTPAECWDYRLCPTIFIRFWPAE